ncbi:MAG: hypothetical protein GY847_39840 [Proteobacteria bacterium]|nr:hypothetical protein [Pseudomonadota bacterium]
MKLNKFNNASDFLSSVKPLLEADEVENNLFLAFLNDLVEHPEKQEELPYMVSLLDHSRAATAAALRIPPIPLIITRLTDDAIALIIDDLNESDSAIPGVLGRAEYASSFARAWSRRKGGSFKLHMGMEMYKLDRVIHPYAPPGSFRQFERKDTSLAAKWVLKFFEEAAPHTPRDPAKKAEEAINEGRLFMWEDSHPVSMAGVVGKTTNGARIALVYTPIEQRNKGYASACVAALSQRVLDSNNKFCFLLADLTNATSNSIYLRVGYQPVYEFKEFSFSS